MILTNHKPGVLEKARQIYGERNQITVATEELCELAAVLSKFPRYDDTQSAVLATRADVLDEFADVSIVMEHIREIFGFTDTQIEMAQARKIDRLERWLDKDSSGSQKITTIDRECEADLYSQGCCEEL